MNEPTFKTKLAQLINQESIDNSLDIPDYLLAELIETQLRAAAAAHKIRKYKKEKPPFENGAIFSKIEEDLFKGWDLKKPSRAFCETITPTRVQELAKVVEKFIKEVPDNVKEHNEAAFKNAHNNGINESQRMAFYNCRGFLIRQGLKIVLSDGHITELISFAHGSYRFTVVGVGILSVPDIKNKISRGEWWLCHPQSTQEDITQMINGANQNKKSENKFKSPKDFLKEKGKLWTDQGCEMMQEYAKEFHNFMMRE